VRPYNKPAKLQASKFLGQHARLILSWRSREVCLSSPSFRVDVRGRGTHTVRGKGRCCAALSFPHLPVDWQAQGTGWGCCCRATREGMWCVPARRPRITFERNPPGECLIHACPRLNLASRDTILPKMIFRFSPANRDAEFSLGLRNSQVRCARCVEVGAIGRPSSRTGEGGPHCLARDSFLESAYATNHLSLEGVRTSSRNVSRSASGFGGHSPRSGPMKLHDCAKPVRSRECRNDRD
jgi:hypothetical protein